VLLSNLEHSEKSGDKFYHDVWMSHGDKVVAVPKGFSIIASTESAPIAAMMVGSRKMYAMQFHPEVTHTQSGQEILNRFFS